MCYISEVFISLLKKLHFVQGRIMFIDNVDLLIYEIIMDTIYKIVYYNKL